MLHSIVSLTFEQYHNHGITWKEASTVLVGSKTVSATPGLASPLVDGASCERLALELATEQGAL